MALPGRLAALLTSMAAAEDGQTYSTRYFNDAIASGTNGTYSGGPGIIIRTPDFLQDGSSLVVPATFWSNDIIAPSQIYPTVGDPMCPNDGSDGFYNTAPDQCDGDKDIWKFATLGMLVSSAMEQMYPDFKNIQDEDWGWAVLYPTDSNSCDLRCIWIDEHTGWDCPGGWTTKDGDWFPDDHQGAGGHEMGNIYAGKGGGGGGCHFDSNAHAIDQADASNSGGLNLVSDYQCQCSYDFKDVDWDTWVEQWIQSNQAKDAFSDRQWLGQYLPTLAPVWGMDVAACWVNNFRDMIDMQNAVYRAKFNWNNQRLPSSDWSQHTAEQLRRFWGWNEVPTDRSIMSDPANWDAILIKLPAMLCHDQDGQFGMWDSLNCLDNEAHAQLERDIDRNVGKQWLLPGFDNLVSRPGSYVVLVREYGVPEPAADSWTSITYRRYFYCEAWTGPVQKYQIVYQPEDESTDGYGACYVDWGACKDCDVPTPAPPAPANSIQNVASGKCLDLSGGGEPHNGQQVWSWDCTGATNQAWWWFDSWISYKDNSDFCLDLNGGGDTTNGNRISIWQCNGGPQQMWIYDDESGSIYLMNNDGKVMDSAGVENGDPLMIWDVVGNANQIWRIGT